MNTNESKGEKYGNTSRATWNLDTTWWGLGPIFREVGVNSIGGVCDIGDPASNQHHLKSSNRYTTAPLVINQAQLDWPHREGFFCKRIEEHKQERINTQSEIIDMYEAKIKVGVQELDSKGLIDTVEEIKNGSPGSL